jgi:excisionase family DNA binding protein
MATPQKNFKFQERDRIPTSQKITGTKRTSKEHPRNAYGTRTEQRHLTVKYMKVLTVREAADLLKVKPQWVYKMVRAGGLPFVRLGRLIRIDEDSLERWLAERRSGGHDVEERRLGGASRARVRGPSVNHGLRAN